MLDRQAVIAKVNYAATNPVKDRLIERVHHSPGVNDYVNLRSRRALRATRPRHFFRNPRPMPEAVTLALSVPPELGPAGGLAALLYLCAVLPDETTSPLNKLINNHV